jgi:N-acetylmuramoyl-L-alanine amidase
MAIIALIAGHNQGTGAVALNGQGEWMFNTEVIRELSPMVGNLGHKVLVFHRDPSLGYTAAMSKLAAQIKKRGCDLALELHFNHSSNAKANGFEFLHWFGSKKSTLLAQCLGVAFQLDFPKMKQRGRNRGARSAWFHRWNEAKAYTGRGAEFLFKTHCPAVICEPFFGSNADDCKAVQREVKKYALSLSNGLELYLQEVTA